MHLRVVHDFLNWNPELISLNRRLAAAFRPDLKSIFALEAYVCFGRAVCLNKMW